MVHGARGGHDLRRRHRGHADPVLVDLRGEPLGEALERGLLGAVARAAARAGRGIGVGAAAEERLTMAPCPRGTMSRSTSWLRMNGAWKFTAHERSQRFSGYSAIGM